MRLKSRRKPRDTDAALPIFIFACSCPGNNKAELKDKSTHRDPEWPSLQPQGLGSHLPNGFRRCGQPPARRNRVVAPQGPSVPPSKVRQGTRHRASPGSAPLPFDSHTRGRGAGPQLFRQPHLASYPAGVVRIRRGPWDAEDTDQAAGIDCAKKLHSNSVALLSLRCLMLGWCPQCYVTNIACIAF